MSRPRLGCGIAGLRRLPPDFVDLVLTDLPSGETRAEFDVMPDLGSFFAASWQALKPTGIIVAMAHSLRFASRLITTTPYYRYEIIWHKSVATGFLNAKKMPLRAHEYVLVFYRKPGTYNIQMSQGHPPIHAATRMDGHGENYGKQGKSTRSRAGATDRYPVSVLRAAAVGTTDSLRIHPQQKPVPLLRWLVRTYSDLGDIVVDPFAGSGSTLVAAAAEDRAGIGWDNSERFGR